MSKPAFHAPQFIIGNKNPGIASAFELAIRFSDWARSLSTPMTWRLIAEHWHVNRATAYRWLAAWKAAQGVGK